MIRRFLLPAMLFAILPVMLMAQTRSDELTVEQSYLQESVELMIIREQSRADSRDMKLVALDYIGEAIERGNRSDELRAALEYLGLEGVFNVTRENGRVLNNFPDVRKQAAAHLGSLGTPEAQKTLMKMVLTDNEPMVITEAIRSLGTIGNNDSSEATDAIVWTMNRFHVLNPDNFMALSTLEAFEKIAVASGGIKDRNVLETIFKIAEGPHYIKPVQDRARALISSLRQLEQNR